MDFFYFFFLSIAHLFYHFYFQPLYRFAIFNCSVLNFFFFVFFPLAFAFSCFAFLCVFLFLCQRKQENYYHFAKMRTTMHCALICKQNCKFYCCEITTMMTTDDDKTQKKTVMLSTKVGITHICSCQKAKWSWWNRILQSYHFIIHSELHLIDNEDKNKPFAWVYMKKILFFRYFIMYFIYFVRFWCPICYSILFDSRFVILYYLI